MSYENLSWIFLTSIFMILVFPLFGQIQTPQAPTFHTYKNTIPNQPHSTPKSFNYNNGLENHKNNLREQQQKEQMLQNIYYETLNLDTRTINYSLPSLSHLPGASSYQTAFNQLLEMDVNSFSVKEANFLVENAFYENKGNYEYFNKVIEEIGEFLKFKMKESGYNLSSNLSKNLILLQFFTDTLSLKSKNLTHYPYKYDFKDYMGYEDWANMFVEKLLRTNSGQCHSLPLLYLILAEEIGAESFLAFSPNHSYIKFKDDQGAWHNVELTNGMLITNALILESGYIKAEALQNQIYMHPLSKEQLFAQLLADLAKGYTVKYGYDEFVKKVIDKAIELDPTNIHAQMVKSDFLTVQFQYVVKQNNISPQNMPLYPMALEQLRQMQEQHRLVDNFGYEEMPLNMYEKWLESLKNARNKQQSQQMIFQLNEKTQDLK